MMGADAYIQYFHSVWLHFAWIYYTIPVYTTYRIVQLSSSYIIIAATVERAILSSESEMLLEETVRIYNGKKYWRTWSGWGPFGGGAGGGESSYRAWVAALILVSAFALRIITVWELQCEYRPQCPSPMGRLEIGRNVALLTSSSHRAFDFYILPLVQIFIPFLVLLLLNLANIKFLEAYNREQEQRRQDARSSNHLIAKFSKANAHSAKPSASRLSRKKSSNVPAKLSVCEPPASGNGDAAGTAEAPSPAGQGAAKEGRAEELAEWRLGEGDVSLLPSPATAETSVRSDLPLTPSPLGPSPVAQTPSPLPRSPSAEVGGTKSTRFAVGEAETESSAAPLSLGAISASIFKERATQQRERDSEQRRLRSATFTLIAIVTTYLTCNVVSLVVSVLEHLPGSPGLFVGGNPHLGTTLFYKTSVDAINFLFMFNSFVRFIIYYCFNAEIRQELKDFLRRVFT